jgi:hypothetical protein
MLERVEKFRIVSSLAASIAQGDSMRVRPSDLL